MQSATRHLIWVGGSGSSAIPVCRLMVADRMLSGSVITNCHRFCVKFRISQDALKSARVCGTCAVGSATSGPADDDDSALSMGTLDRAAAEEKLDALFGASTCAALAAPAWKERLETITQVADQVCCWCATLNGRPRPLHSPGADHTECCRSCGRIMSLRPLREMQCCCNTLELGF